MLYTHLLNSRYSKAFPEVSESIVSQKQSSKELDSISGLIGGIEQGLKEGRDLVNERQSELEEIQKNNNLDIDIER